MLYCLATASGYGSKKFLKLPYDKFLELYELTTDQEMAWYASGRKTSPLSLMLLRALRYTGRGFMFDTDVSVETQLVFYHTFIEWEALLFLSIH